MEKNLNEVKNEVKTVVEITNNSVKDEVLEEDLLIDYVKTDLFVERTANEAINLDKIYYNYSVHSVITRGKVVKEFNVNLTGHTRKDSNNNEIKDGGIYMLLDLIFAESDKMPLYVRKVSYTDIDNKKQYSIKYAVGCMIDGLGELVVAMKPRSASDTNVLELVTKRFIN